MKQNMIDPKSGFAVLGLARSGIAAGYKLKELGAAPYLSDLRPAEEFPNSDELRRTFTCEFGGHSDRLLDFPCWIVSPGIPLDAPIIIKGRKAGIRLISEIELGWLLKHPDSRIIAVTGSNGKSTTASLIHHILKETGHACILAGNIGSAFCGYPIEKPGLEYIVLEISSFQLDLIESFRPDVAVLLNITPDHLNRYASYGDYIQSKFRVFMNQSSADTAVICVDSEPVAVHQDQINAQIRRYSLEKVAPEVDAWMNRDAIQVGLRHKLQVQDLQIRGRHNYANTMAALLSVNSLTQDLDAAMAAALTYTPLPHRLEYVATIRGVLFYNDSKATNTDSARSALTAFDKPIRVIMGGSGKGEDFSELTPILQTWAQKVYLTGATAERMHAVWQGAVDLKVVQGFEKCIREAFLDALPGDIIVLSPACASFDQFRNFEHRGDTFKEIVHRMELENEER